MERIFLTLSSAMGFLAVALGAFGAHGLKTKLAQLPDAKDRLAWWETGAHYHLTHALALGLVAFLVARAPSSAANASGWLFLAGMLIFCGSLYAMTLTGVRVLGAITPLGGLCLLGGWSCLGYAAWTSLRP